MVGVREWRVSSRKIGEEEGTTADVVGTATNEEKLGEKEDGGEGIRGEEKEDEGSGGSGGRKDEMEEGIRIEGEGGEEEEGWVDEKGKEVSLKITCRQM